MFDFPPSVENKTITNELNASLQNVPDYILIFSFTNLYRLRKTSLYISDNENYSLSKVQHPA